MNGKTVVSSLAPPALPDAATAAPFFSVRRMYGRVARPDGIDGPGPALRVERPSLSGHLVPGQDPGRTQGQQPRCLVGLAGRGPDLVAALGEDRQGRAAHAARRAGDEDRARVGLQPAVLERRRRTSPR